MPTSLRGIIPILITPFHPDGSVDESSLRRVVRFELEGGAHGLGVGGFASEAYKLTDQERLHCAEVVAEEVNGQVPLIIGMAPGSTEAAIAQAHAYAALNPAALMTLPPSTMKLDEAALVEHYVELGNASPVPIMMQQSPQIQQYAHCQLETEHLARIHHRSPNVRYFKIEGPGSAKRIHALRERVPDEVKLFGGVGGIALRDELRAGAAGLLPGVGFNEFFMQVWAAWEAGDMDTVETTLGRAQELVEAVSGSGHEYSLHARKYLLHRAGIIASPLVRRPSVMVDTRQLEALGDLVDALGLRIGRRG
jgi:4-hydroxy-tetrahydrodipicolinate synthase